MEISRSRLLISCLILRSSDTERGLVCPAIHIRVGVIISWSHHQTLRARCPVSHTERVCGIERRPPCALKAPSVEGFDYDSYRPWRYAKTYRSRGFNRDQPTRSVDSVVTVRIDGLMYHLPRAPNTGRSDEREDPKNLFLTQRPMMRLIMAGAQTDSRLDSAPAVHRISSYSCRSKNNRSRHRD